MMSPMAMGMFVVPDLKAVHKRRGAGNEVADGNANRHGEKDPER